LLSIGACFPIASRFFVALATVAGQSASKPAVVTGDAAAVFAPAEVIVDLTALLQPASATRIGTRHATVKRVIVGYVPRRLVMIVGA
jgi:hypothetical protein